MVIVFTLYLQYDAIIVKGDHVHLKDLLPILHFDLQLVNETEGTLENFKDVSADVLLLSGSKSPLLLKKSPNALNKVLPQVSRIELPGFGHEAAANSGKLKRIAQELQRFFL